MSRRRHAPRSIGLFGSAQFDQTISMVSGGGARVEQSSFALDQSFPLLRSKPLRGKILMTVKLLAQRTPESQETDVSSQRSYEGPHKQRQPQQAPCSRPRQ